LSAATPLRVGFSAGIARFDESSIEGDMVISNAIAMADAARRQGGGRVGFHDLR
jgi:hypothetical protein